MRIQGAIHLPQIKETPLYPTAYQIGKTFNFLEIHALWAWS